MHRFSFSHPVHVQLITPPNYYNNNMHMEFKCCGLSSQLIGSEKIGWKNHKPTRCLFVCLYDVINYLLHYLTSNMADICGTLLLVQSQLGIESASRSFWWERNKQQNKNKTQLFDLAKTLEILLSSSVGWLKRSKFLIMSG